MLSCQVFFWQAIPSLLLLGGAEGFDIFLTKQYRLSTRKLDFMPKIHYSGKPQQRIPFSFINWEFGSMTLRCRVNNNRELEYLFSTCLVLFLGLLVWQPVAVAAVVDATWNAASVGDWGDATNWDINPVVPDNNGDTYNVFINDGTTTLDAEYTIDDFTMTGGTLDGFEILNVTGATSFSGTTTLDGVEFNAMSVSIAVGATVNVIGFPILTIDGDLTLGVGGKLNLGDASDGADLEFFSAAPTISGGEIVLSETGNSTILATNATISAGTTIRGPGAISSSTAFPAFNLGKITSDVSGGFLFLDAIDNFALPGPNPIEGLNGGSIQFEDGQNLGRIEVSGGGDLLTTNIDNDAILTITDGTLRLDGNWSNNPVTGQISGTNATISIRNGTFTFANLGTVIRTNTVLELGGGAILNNAGDTLDLDNSTGAKGSWTMRGGTIRGGTVQTSNGASLIFASNSNGTLDGVTLNSSPEMQNFSSIFVQNGLTLNGTTIDLSNGATGAANLTFITAGPQTLSGTGTIVLGNSLTRGVSNSSGGVATIGSGILIRGQTGRVHNVVNQGTVSADVSGSAVAFQDAVNGVGGTLEAKNGGILRLEDDWDNNGVIDVQDGSQLDLLGTNDTADIGTIQRIGATTVRLLGGTLNNAGNSLDLQNDVSGDLVLAAGGTIVGGTVTSSGSAIVRYSASTVSSMRLAGVTLAANLETTGTNGKLQFDGGLTLAGATINPGGGNQVIFDGGSQTFGGTGELDVSAAATIANRSNTGGVVTFGPDVMIRVSSDAVIDGKHLGAAGGFLNQGTILVEGASASASLFDLQNVGGTIQVDATGTLGLNNSQNETSFVQTSGELILNGTATGIADVEIRGGTLSGSGSLRLNGTLDQLLAETGGTISPGNSIDTLLVDGDVVIGDGGIFSVEVDGSGDADLLSIIQGAFQPALGDIDLSSTSDFLDVTNLSGDVNGNQFVVLEYAGSRIGTFDNVTSGVNVIYDDPNNRILVEPTALPVVFDADFDDDSDIDGADFLTWQRGFGLMGQTDNTNGDATFDGTINGADLAVWESQFSSLSIVLSASQSVPEPTSVLLLAGCLATAALTCRRVPLLANRDRAVPSGLKENDAIALLNA